MDDTTVGGDVCAVIANAITTNRAADYCDVSGDGAGGDWYGNALFIFKE